MGRNAARHAADDCLACLILPLSQCPFSVLSGRLSFLVDCKRAILLCEGWRQQKRGETWGINLSVQKAILTGVSTMKIEEKKENRGGAYFLLLHHVPGLENKTFMRSLRKAGTGRP